jgi:hypothetical protein
MRVITSGVHHGPGHLESTVHDRGSRPTQRSARLERGELGSGGERWRPGHLLRQRLLFLLGGGGAPISAAAELLQVSNCETLVSYPWILA